MKRGILISVLVLTLLISGIYIKSTFDNDIKVNAEKSLQGVSVVLDAGHGGTS